MQYLPTFYFDSAHDDSNSGGGDGSSKDSAYWKSEAEKLQKDVAKLTRQIEGKDGTIKQYQTDVSNLKEELKTLNTDFERVQAEAVHNQTELQTQINALTTERETLASEREQLQTSYDKLNRTSELSSLIMGEYPELSALYANGGVKPFDDDGNRLDGDNLRSYLDTLKNAGIVAQQARQMAQQEAKEQDLSGSRPPAQVTPSSQPTKQELGEKLLQMKPTDPQYKELMALYEKQVTNFDS